jgi:regulator of RNase E activity RraA
MTRPTLCCLAICLASTLVAPPLRAQINTLTKEQMIDYTAQNLMPGDLVVGDREGIYFIPPQFAQEVVDKADEVHVHDE